LVAGFEREKKNFRDNEHVNRDTFCYHTKDVRFSSVLKSKTEILNLKKNSKVNTWTLQIEAGGFFFSEKFIPIYEGWNFNSGNYLFTTDTK